MSFRTIFVGILAAICGVSATVGVNLLNSRPSADNATTIVVARMNIPYGVQVSDDMVESRKSPANLLPPGSLTDLDRVVGQYSIASMTKDEPVMRSKLSEQPTNLQIPDGMRGVAIQTLTESSAVGRLIVPGNRVDVVLTITNRNQFLQGSALGGPTTWTLFENVEVLAVGQRYAASTGDVDPQDKKESVTLSVTPEMAEDINLAAEIGKLHLTLRSATDDSSIQPKRKVSIRELLAAATSEVSEEQPPNQEMVKVTSEMQRLWKELLDFKDSINGKMNEVAATETEQAVVLKIPPGMRGVTIQTPTESTAVAGLLIPGNKVDLLLTITTVKRQARSLLDAARSEVQTITMLENVEVLAVDTKVDVNEADGEPKMSRSVTLLVTPEMAQDVSLAQQVGTLALSLRGAGDDSTGPISAVNLQELLSPADTRPTSDGEGGSGYRMVRINRGGFSQDLRFYYNPPGK